jgi:hypothetical protein
MSLPAESLSDQSTASNRGPRSRPVFLSLLAWWFAFAAAIGAFLLPFLLLAHSDSYAINGRSVSRGDFLAFLRPQVPLLSALIVATGATAWSLWTERRLGRPFATTLLVVTAAGAGLDPSVHQPWQITVLVALAVGLPLAWYFYRKPNVVAYYQSLRGKGSQAAVVARSNEEL